MKSEAAIQNDVRKRAGELGIHLFRNNVGACEDAKSGRIIRYGLANDSAAMNKAVKSGDLIGWMQDGRFLSVECKHEGWTCPRTPSAREEAQMRWAQMIRNAGGIAGFVASVKDFDKLLGI